MSFNKFENISYCVAGKHYSGTINIKGDLTSNGRQMLIRRCTICNRKKCLIFSDNTIKAEGLGSFSKVWGRFRLKLVEN